MTPAGELLAAADRVEALAGAATEGPSYQGVLIGEFSAEPKQCGDEHLPGCWNDVLDRTWCICGEQTWDGDQGSWHSRQLWSTAGQGAELLGYDLYYLPPHDHTAC
ncbi:MAG TPA: hypothetical protein VGH54_09835 [Mycobacterium sp.]|uniref:hypothetical protein n=1 Tax=Mycobacterium sp. TaxID=1785 RepID=UPI002F4293E2